MAEPQSSIQLKDLFQRVSTHLDVLAAEVHAIEHAIGEDLGDDAQLDGGFIKRLQRLDFLRQSLEDLSLLNRSIADHCKGTIAPKIADQLSLAATKGVVLAPNSHGDLAGLSKDTGELDLF